MGCGVSGSPNTFSPASDRSIDPASKEVKRPEGPQNAAEGESEDGGDGQVGAHMAHGLVSLIGAQVGL